MPNYHGTHNTSNEYEQKHNQSLLSLNFNNAITYILSPPYPSTIYIPQNNNHNKQLVDDDQNRQSLPIPYTKIILPKINENVCIHPKHKNKFQFLKDQNNIWSSSAQILPTLSRHPSQHSFITFI